MTAALLGEKSTRKDLWTGPVVDADVHVTPGSIEVLLPYMEPEWREFVRERSIGEPMGLANVYPPNAPSTAREEWRPADGRKPASELSMLQQDLLDPWDVEHAIVNCYYATDWVRHPDFNPGLVRALNDWLIGEFLEKDPRLRASMVMPSRNPYEMVKEIERVGDHPGFVQAYLPVRNEQLWGNRLFHPVWAELEKHDLVFGLHWGGASEVIAPSPTGWASWYIEEYVGEQQAFMAQLLSLTAEGVFAACPDLRFSVGEIGFTWLPPLWWRMETKRKGLRRDIPWVNQPIEDLFRERVRFTVAPIDAGPPEQLAKTLEWLGTEDMLMFASDYPHRHDDRIEDLLDLLPENGKQKLMADNARAWYGL
jgi:predicted TIM-barrel fold metal-dependent hydrolase